MIWLFVVFFPLFLAVVVLSFKKRGFPGALVGALGPLPALALVLSGVEPAAYHLKDFLLGSHLGFEDYGRPFLLLTALVWTGAGIYGVMYRAVDYNQNIFTIFFLTCMCGNLGLAIAQDAVSFYAFFALMTFSGYVLVVHHSTQKAWKAGRVYLIMAVLGEGAVVAGMMIGVHSAQSTLFSEIARVTATLSWHHPLFWLLFTGFGIKAGVLGLHFWLPLAHPAAPAPASAVLSGTMIKAGLLGMIHFFPLGLVSFSSWGSVFICLGLGGAFFGVLAGLLEKDPKTILAYSSISQIGLMLFLCGLGIIEAQLWTIGLPVLFLFIIHHGLIKAVLFLGVDIAGYVKGSRRSTYLLLAGLALPAIALAGAPLTSGSWIKYLLKDMVELVPGVLWITILLSLSSLGTAMLMAHFLSRLHLKNPDKPHYRPGLLFIWLGMAAAGVILPLIVGLIYLDVPDVSWIEPRVVWSSLWPIVFGALIYFFFNLKKPSLSWQAAENWPDTVTQIEKAWRKFYPRWEKSNFCDPSCGQINFVNLADRLIFGPAGLKVTCMIEALFRQWFVAGLVFVLLILIFILMGSGRLS